VKDRFLEPTQENGAALLRRNIPGEVVMLNMLRLREIADYSENPELRRIQRSPAGKLCKGISITPCRF